MAGAMKLFVPSLGAAFAGQLAAADIPFQDLNRWVVPFVEMGVGGALLAGHYARLAALLVLNIMVVATYVHLVANDPSLFPLQPEKPIIPIAAMVLALYLLLRGAGAGSSDRNATGGAPSSDGATGVAG
jgi:uncharacterized membrane protein YphA (DoxX/SURF4 family)